MTQFKVDYQQWKVNKLWGIYSAQPVAPVKPKDANLMAYISDRLGVRGTHATEMHPTAPRGNNRDWDYQQKAWTWEVDAGKVLLWSEEGDGDEDEEMTG